MMDKELVQNIWHMVCTRQAHHRIYTQVLFERYFDTDETAFGIRMWDDWVHVRIKNDDLVEILKLDKETAGNKIYEKWKEHYELHR